MRRAVKAITSGHCRTAANIQRKLFPYVSKILVRRVLAEQGLHGSIMQKKPYLNARHKRLRREWAEARFWWTVEDWKRVVISDESKFNLFGSDGRLYCRRRVGEEFKSKNVKKTVSHGGGKVTVWGCVTWKGVGRLYRIEGILKAPELCQIYQEALLGTLADHDMLPSDIIFQQDNDPKHTSKMATEWLKGHGLTKLPWPANSPDMSIIENLWDHLDDRICSRNPLPSNENQLWEALKEEWAKITPEVVQHYYRTIPRRVEALYKARGDTTKY
jgi:hypothetical protein